MLDAPAEAQLSADALVVFGFPRAGKRNLQLQAFRRGQRRILPERGEYPLTDRGRKVLTKPDLDGPVLTKARRCRTF